MTVTFDTSNGPIVVSESLVAATARSAERRADIAAVAIKALRRAHPEIELDDVTKSVGFLLEWSAVLELAFWDQQGLLEHLDADLPTVDEAAKELAVRAAKGITEFNGPNAIPLHMKVMRVSLEHFAWDAPGALQAEILLGKDDDEQLADRLAEFIWNHRHALSGNSSEGDSRL